MPSQKENLLNQILYKLVQESPYYEALNREVRTSPMLSLDEYTLLLIQHGAKDFVLYQKVYPIIAESVDTLFQFISGSALIPYMEKLSEPLRSDLAEEFKRRIALHFTSSPMVYAFKRIILVAGF